MTFGSSIMDCEKFDQILIDALYDELDDLTLAGAKRHADGCQRCRTAWSGLRATRKVGMLPMIEPPASLESRILARAREAHRNVSWSRRVGRAVSWAGAFAMRPQTAMAAVLVLVLTASLFLIRAKPDRSGAPSRVRITERGVPQQAPDEMRQWDRPAADNRGNMPAPPAAPAAPPARKDEERAKAAEPSVVAQAARPPAPAAFARGESPQGAPAAEPEPVRVAASKRSDDLFAEAPPEAAKGIAPAAPAGLDLGDTAGAAAPGPPADRARKSETAGGAAAPSDPYAAAMALYTAGRYAEAEKAFSAVAAAGGKNAPSAALYAAKSAEANLGCGSAAAKYENVASRYASTSPGAEALWCAANCYKTLGVVDKARSIYLTLRGVAGYRDRAEAELANLAPSPRGAAKASARPPAAAPASK
jgi:TolA-binding protein